MPYIVILVIIIIVIAVFMKKGIFIVKQAEVIIIERLGRYEKTLLSGLNFIIPFIDSPRKIRWKYVQVGPNGRNMYFNADVDRIDLRETVYDFPRQNVITRDNVTLEINALLYFQIVDPKRAIYEILNLPDAIEKLTQTTLRNVLGGLDLDQTLASRDTINSKLRIILDEATEKWGIKVNRVELQDIKPPDEIQSAMEKQMRAERDKRASILTAEGQKQSQILEAEGFRDSQIARAEGEKRARILESEGIAEAKIKIAQGESDAINNIKKSIVSESESIQFILAMKYIEAFQKLASTNNNTVFMPYEATSVLSSIGSIKELFSANMKK
ncbi:MAG: SPFH/Band 7/PHB domain protein [Fusobacteria bacterium]|nr:SPFH/Band 7/PHB domain protein [Fusobacteriota bacterium]